MCKESTYFKGLRTLSISIMFAVALTCVGHVRAAASPQVCTSSQSCSIGEFLYDDSYQPITDGVCTFTSRNPDGSMFINAASLTSTADGWYAHEFTTPTVEGVYRSQICCTADSQYLCIDKSFESRVKANLTTSEVTDAVWNAERSSHKESGTFGLAVQKAVPSTSAVASAVWGYSDRTLSSFTSLVTDMWSNTTRTLTGPELTSGSLAKKEDVTNPQVQQIQEDTHESRILLEKQVNKPVIESTIEDTGDLQTKIKTTQEKAKNMYFLSAQTRTKLVKLNKQWTSLSQSQRLEYINEIIMVVGEPTDKPNKETLFGMTTWFTSQWNFALGKTASKNVGDLYTQLKQTQGRLASRKSGIVFFPQRTLNTTVLLKLNIGEIGDDDQQTSLFGEINEMVQFVADLEDNNKKLSSTLKSWKKMPVTEKENMVVLLHRDILALNKVPHVNALVKPIKIGITDKELHNKVLFLTGLVKANKSLLANSQDKSFASSWLELGSIVFKTLVTNPSTLITQDAEVKYYLPKEVKKEDVLEIDEGLTLKLDSEKNQYYVDGTFELEPGDSKILSVRVTDIWVFSEKEIASLKEQANALVEPLNKTSYFAQGVTIKSDIDVALDKILLRQSQAETPEAKLVAYSESQIELADVKLKMDKLKDLVTQAGSTGTFFGFVGATQTLAVWGLIMVISAGFIFLTLYMRKLSVVPDLKKVEEKPIKPTKKAEVAPAAPLDEKMIHHARPKPNLLMVAFIIAYGTAAVSISSSITYSVTKKNTLAQAKVLGAQSAQNQVKCEVPAVENKLEKESEENTEESDIQERSEAKESESAKEISMAEAEHQIATITETPTGWLRVRKTPSGSELAKVDVGESFPVIEEVNSWVKIQLEDSSQGWVSSKYALVAQQ